MKDELNCPHNGGGDAYLLQSGAIHFNHTVVISIPKLQKLASNEIHPNRNPSRLTECTLR